MFSLCLNPCFDRDVEVAEFAVGATNRALSARRTASGKGVNVAVAARRLGLASKLVGFFRREGGAELAARLDGEGVAYRDVWVDGALRENVKIHCRKTSVVTELNEAGAPVPAEALERLFAALAEEMAGGGVWALTGSLPPGAPPDTYLRIMRMANGLGAVCALDAAGEAFRLGLEGGPALAKPNRFELETAVGRALPRMEDVRDAALELCDRGAGAVLASLGAEGALMVGGGRVWFAPAVKTAVRTTVGAGDAMLAGALYAREQGLPLGDWLAWGAAAAASCVARGEVERDAAVRFLERVELKEIS